MLLTTNTTSYSGSPESLPPTSEFVFNHHLIYHFSSEYISQIYEVKLKRVSAL